MTNDEEEPRPGFRQDGWARPPRRGSWLLAGAAVLVAAAMAVLTADRDPAEASEPCCRRCGRPLTDPVSIARGFGPTCWWSRGD